MIFFKLQVIKIELSRNKINNEHINTKYVYIFKLDYKLFHKMNY